MPISEHPAAVELLPGTQEDTAPEVNRSHTKLRIALAIVLSSAGCLALFVACAACLAYFFNVPVHFSWFLIGGTVLGCGPLYVSSRLWVRWRLGVGVIAIAEGGLLIRLSVRPLLAADSTDRAIAQSLFVTAVLGLAAGITLVARERLAKRG